jgi:hypothetical protein
VLLREFGLKYHPALRQFCNFVHRVTPLRSNSISSKSDTRLIHFVRGVCLKSTTRSMNWPLMLGSVLRADCGMSSAYEQPQREPSRPLFRDDWPPHLSQKIPVLWCVGANSFDLECRSASIQKGGRRPTMRRVPAVPGRPQELPAEH